jgi:hypothetical protein
MITRMVIQLDAAERSALIQLADRVLREPRAQMRAILRRELNRLGLLNIGVSCLPQAGGNMSRDTLRQQAEEGRGGDD